MSIYSPCLWLSNSNPSNINSGVAPSTGALILTIMADLWMRNVASSMRTDNLLLQDTKLLTIIFCIALLCVPHVLWQTGASELLSSYSMCLVSCASSWPGPFLFPFNPLKCCILKEAHASDIDTVSSVRMPADLVLMQIAQSGKNKTKSVTNYHRTYSIEIISWCKILEFTAPQDDHELTKL